MLIALDSEERVEAGHVAEDMFIRQMKHRRAKLNLSQSDLAERVVRLGGSMYQQTIAKIESGQRAVRLGEADVIAQALETTVTKMLSEAIDQAASGTVRLSVTDLRTQINSARNRLMGAEAMLDDATLELENAEVRLSDAQFEVMRIRAEVDRLRARRDAISAELAHVSSLSMEKQSELNRRLGPRWQEKIKEDPKLEWASSPEPEPTEE